MDKKLQIKLNANRMVVGTLRGFDQFMNLVVDNTVEVNGNEKTDIGMVVIRGNSVVTVEALEPVGRMHMAGTFNKHHSAKFVALGLTITYKKAKRAEAVRNQSIKMHLPCKRSLPFSTIHCFINYVSQIRLLVSIGCIKLGHHSYPNIQKK
ncbi:hypothetical protein CXB51_022598 [Gossypium anomalum]|uniref:Small nuclear ribonucleoprotein G n=1 Tax=Gossypium anomalum TaxID=47600 RepID=A0A8J5Z8M2_9ROSI|nr:hypothetical protein CXB51_022598 [Gossypium anomalum]